jgi:hypothetical protein
VGAARPRSRHRAPGAVARATFRSRNCPSLNSYTQGVWIDIRTYRRMMGSPQTR